MLSTHRSDPPSLLWDRWVKMNWLMHIQVCSAVNCGLPRLDPFMKYLGNVLEMWRAPRLEHLNLHPSWWWCLGRLGTLGGKASGNFVGNWRQALTSCPLFTFWVWMQCDQTASYSCCLVFPDMMESSPQMVIRINTSSLKLFLDHTHVKLTKNSVTTLC